MTTSIPTLNNGQLYWYVRHTFGDVPVPRIMREAKKLARQIRALAEMGDVETVRELVERINSAPSL